ncbi:hypothetical protein ACFWD7_55915 [Streptomyces mirabilis]|uniref:hypothetical protein n=1 Tax=Streptomyces mirabilis TaxID=68239 RepID=UPI0036B90618
MLPDPTVPASLLAVLELLRGCFTAPTFTTFSSLVTGLIAQTGRPLATHRTLTRVSWLDGRRKNLLP